MRKLVGILLLAVMVLVMAGCGTKDTNTTDTAKWDCSVECAEESSPDGYVITYSEEAVTCRTGTLTVQNRNSFDIVVHLLCVGEDERVSDPIPAGGSYSFLHMADGPYTVGIHADAAEKMEIQVFVYDGETTEPYTR